MDNEHGDGCQCKSCQCKKREYHYWDATTINSTGEDYNEMDIEIQCKDCGAWYFGSGDWEV